MFPNLESLVETVLSFPHSNAEAERIFSIVNDVKNKKRNRLSNTVSAICTIRSSFQVKGINYTNFDVDSEHLKLHNPQNLYIYQAIHVMVLNIPLFLYYVFYIIFFI